MDRHSIFDIKNKRLKIRYNTERQIKDVIGEFTMFLVFVFIETLVCLSLRHRNMFYMNQLFNYHFLQRTIFLQANVALTFDTVFTIEDIHDFIEANFLTGLFGSSQYEDTPKWNDTKPDNDTTTTEPGLTLVPPEVEPKPPPVPDMKKRRNIDVKKYNGKYNDDYNDFDFNEIFAELQSPDIEPKPFLRNERSSRDENEESVSDSMDELNDMNDFEDYGEFNNISLPRPRLEELNIFFEPYNKTPYQTGNGSLLQDRTFLYFNELLGPPRIRQIRTKPIDCWFQEPNEVFDQICYPIYTPETEDKSPYHKGSKYYTIDELQSTWIFATINYYTGGGYVEQMSLNRTENNILLQHLRDIKWIDEGSRLIMVEFNTYSRTAPLITQVELMFEIPACGTVLPSYRLKTVLKHSFITTKSTAIKSLVIIWYCFIVYYTIREFQAIVKLKWRYIIYTINWVDLIIIVFAYLFFLYNCWKLRIMMRIESQVGSDEFISVDRLITWQIIYIDTFAVHLILVYMKIFHYINFTMTIAQLTLTLKIAIKELLCISFVILLFAFSYSIAGILLFGNYHRYFARLTLSLLALLRFILFDFQYQQIGSISPVLAPFFFLSFMIVVYFVILQIFLVIIMATYNLILKEDLAKEPRLFTYMGRHVRKVLRCFLKYFRFVSRCVKRNYDRIFSRFRVTFPEPPSTVRITEMQPMGPKVLLRSEVKPTYLSQFEGPSSYSRTTKKVRNLFLIRVKNRIALLEECITPLSYQMEDICRRLVRYIHKYQEERRRRRAENPNAGPEEAAFPFSRRHRRRRYRN